MKVVVTGKGGSGKTTVAGTLARHLARRGHRVVAVDCDPSPNLGLTLGLPPDRVESLEAVLNGLVAAGHTHHDRSVWSSLLVASASCPSRRKAEPCPDLLHDLLHYPSCEGEDRRDARQRLDHGHAERFLPFDAERQSACASEEVERPAVVELADVDGIVVHAESTCSLEVQALWAS